MKEVWFVLYEAMLKELEDLNRQPSDYKNKIESCFNRAQQYWTQIQSTIEDYNFTSTRDEIEFYKLVKPLFKSQTEYYNLLYQAEILKPEETTGEMIEFWIREQQKLDKFIIDNAAFYMYYKSGSSDKDEMYFLMSGQKGSNGRTIYFDDLIATLMALERYKHYTQNELSRYQKRTQE